MFTQNFFNLLPEDVLGEILDHLSPTDAEKAAQITESLDKANHDNLSWKKKFTWHFPNRLKEFEGILNVDWKKAYEATANDEYSTLSKTERLILELVKQSDAPGLAIHFGSADQSSIEFETLLQKDKNGTSILDWVKKVGSRQTEQYIYNVIKKYYITHDEQGQAIDPQKRDSHKRTILFWAITLHEEWNEIEFLISFVGCSLNVKCGVSVLPTHLAATDGTFEIFKTFIKNYPELLQQKDQFGQTPLLFAARKGNLKHIHYLIEKGVNLNITTQMDNDTRNNGKTALHWAIQEGHTDVGLALIEAGADLNLAAGTKLLLPIHVAIEKKNTAVLAALLQKKPSLISERDAYGRTPLMLAADESVNDINMVKYLLSNGANPNFTYNRPQQGNNLAHISHDKTALYWALERDSNEIALALIKAGATVTTALGNEQSQPIHLVARKGNLELLKAITEKPYRAGLINQVDALGRSPLMLAVEAGQTEVVNYLITKNADLNLAQNEHGQSPGITALYSAISNNHTEIALALIKEGAHVITVVGNERTQPIHLVARNGNFQVLRALIEKHPALINQVDALGRSPLMLAVEAGQTEVVNYLITKNADLNLAQNEHGQSPGITALSSAISNNHTEIALTLIEAGAIVTTAFGGDHFQPIHLAARRHVNFPVLRALIEKHPTLINEVDVNGQSPLMLAAEECNLEAANYLIAKGADLNLTQNSPGWHQGRTALHIAISVHSKIAVALIKAGADVTLAYKGLQPLQMAISSGNKKVLKALIRKHPDIINQKDAHGRSPLMLIFSQNQMDEIMKVDCATVLLQNGAVIDQSINHFPLPKWFQTKLNFYKKLHEVTNNFISQIPHLRKYYEGDETIRPICDELEKYFEEHPNSDLIYPRDLRELWKRLSAIANLFTPSMGKINQQAETLCAAIIHHKECFKTWPEIQTLEELIIAQQKYEFMDEIFKKNQNIYRELYVQIYQADTTVTLRTILKEDSLFLKAKVGSNSIQSAINQEELSQKRIVLRETDPAIVLGNDTALQNAGWREKAVAIHASLIEMRHDYELRGRETHLKHIDHLIRLTTNLIKVKAPLDAYMEIEKLLLAAYKIEKDNYQSKPWSWTLFSDPTEQFQKRLDKNDDHCYHYPRLLRNIISKHRLGESQLIIQSDKTKAITNYERAYSLTSNAKSRSFY